MDSLLKPARPPRAASRRSSASSAVSHPDELQPFPVTNGHSNHANHSPPANTSWRRRASGSMTSLFSKKPPSPKASPPIQAAAKEESDSEVLYIHRRSEPSSPVLPSAPADRRRSYSDSLDRQHHHHKRTDTLASDISRYSQQGAVPLLSSPQEMDASYSEQVNIDAYGEPSPSVSSASLILPTIPAMDTFDFGPHSL